MVKARRAVRVLKVVSAEDMVGVRVGMTMRDASVVQRRYFLSVGLSAGPIAIRNSIHSHPREHSEDKREVANAASFCLVFL